MTKLQILVAHVDAGQMDDAIEMLPALQQELLANRDKIHQFVRARLLHQRPQLQRSSRDQGAESHIGKERSLRQIESCTIWSGVGASTSTPNDARLQSPDARPGRT